MGKNEGYIQLDDMLLFFPILFKNFIDFIFSFLDDQTPRIYIGVLLVLIKCGPMPISHIGERLSIAKPNMTPLIRDLLKNGWIKRYPSREDKRVATIELTEKGQSYITGTIKKLDCIVKEKFSILSKDESYEFVKSLDKVIALGNKVLAARDK